VRVDTHDELGGNSLVLESLLTSGKCVYVVVKCTYQTACFGEKTSEEALGGNGLHFKPFYSALGNQMFIL